MKFFWSALVVIMLIGFGCKSRSKEEINERNFWQGNVQFNPSAFGNRWSEYMPQGFLAQVEYWTRLPNPRHQYGKPVLEGVFAPNEWSIYHAELEDDGLLGKKWKPVARIQIGWCWLVAFHFPYTQRAIFAVPELNAKKVAEKLLAAKGDDDDLISFFPNNLPWENSAFGRYKKKVTASSRVRKKFPGLFKEAGAESLATRELEFEVGDVFGSSVDGGTNDWVIALNDYPNAVTAETIVGYGHGWIIGIMHPVYEEPHTAYTRTWVWYPPQKAELILKGFTKIK